MKHCVRHAFIILFCLAFPLQTYAMDSKKIKIEVPRLKIPTCDMSNRGSFITFPEEIMEFIVISSDARWWNILSKTFYFFVSKLSTPRSQGGSGRLIQCIRCSFTGDFYPHDSQRLFLARNNGRSLGLLDPRNPDSLEPILNIKESIFFIQENLVYSRSNIGIEVRDLSESIIDGKMLKKYSKRRKIKENVRKASVQDNTICIILYPAQPLCYNINTYEAYEINLPHASHEFTQGDFIFLNLVPNGLRELEIMSLSNSFPPIIYSKKNLSCVFVYKSQIYIVYNTGKVSVQDPYERNEANDLIEIGQFEIAPHEFMFAFFDFSNIGHHYLTLNDLIYFAYSTDGHITVVDSDTHTVLTSVETGNSNAIPSLYAVGNYVFVVSGTVIYIVDPNKKHTIVREIHLGQRIGQVSLVDRFLILKVDKKTSLKESVEQESMIIDVSDYI